MGGGGGCPVRGAGIASRRQRHTHMRRAEPDRRDRPLVLAERVEADLAGDAAEGGDGAARRVGAGVAGGRV